MCVLDARDDFQCFFLCYSLGFSIKLKKVERTINKLKSSKVYSDHSSLPCLSSLKKEFFSSFLISGRAPEKEALHIFLIKITSLRFLCFHPKHAKWKFTRTTATDRLWRIQHWNGQSLQHQKRTNEPYRTDSFKMLNVFTFTERSMPSYYLRPSLLQDMHR